MSETWFEELKSKVEGFLETATKKDLDKAFEKAGYDFYKTVKAPMVHYSINSDAYSDEISYELSINCSIKQSSHKGEMRFTSGIATDDYSKYTYDLAA